MSAKSGMLTVARVRAACVAGLMMASVAGGVLAPMALGDGDPASDYLVSNQVFLASLPASVTRPQRELLAEVRAANHSGFVIRVAIVPSTYDLGSITELWRRPRLYARFLGLELSSTFRGRLLVVMPSGFGFDWPGHSAAPAYHLLAGVPIGRAGDGLAVAARTAVRQLAGADGVALPAAAGGGTPTNRARDIALAAAAAIVLVALLFLGRTWPARIVSKLRELPPVRARGKRIPLRWVVAGFAVLCVAAIGAPIALVRIFRRPSSLQGSESSVVTPPPVSWPAGRRRAPEFALRDQRGHRVSLAAYRGRPVILTFVDPLCRNLCPLEAKVLNAAVDKMPVSRRPAIIAVSVDVYADSRRDLLQDVHKWELVPQWHWAVGRPAQLAAVWKHYRIGVSITTKRIASTTIKYITHTEAAYILDPTGHERALFLWPFYPQDVERILRDLA